MIKRRGGMPPVGVVQRRARGVPELLAAIKARYPGFDEVAMCGEPGVYAGTVREIPGDDDRIEEENEQCRVR